jgi:hypothetical protein
MVADDRCLRANERDVAAKVVDGEAILINLSNGLYFSMDKVGAYIWLMITAGSTVELIARSVSERYGVPVDRTKPEVRGLVAELLNENLIEAGDGVPAPAASTSAGTEPYQPPKLVRYDDMAGMFALDPPLPELPAAPKTRHA